jgi:hypothetical protein
MTRAPVLVIIGAILLRGASHAAPLPSINALVTIDEEFFGCSSLADLARVVNLDWVKNDKAGATAYGREHCIVLHKGDQYRVHDVSVAQGAVCLRQTNSSDCYWTNAQLLKSP